MVAVSGLAGACRVSAVRTLNALPSAWAHREIRLVSDSSLAVQRCLDPAKRRQALPDMAHR